MRAAIRPLVSALGLVVLLATAGGTTERGAVANHPRQALEFEATVESQVIRGLVLPGHSLQIQDHERGVNLTIGVALEPGPPNADPVASVQLHQVSDGADGGLGANLVDSTRLVAGDSTLLFESGYPVDIRFIGLQEVPNAIAAAGPQDLRPTNCCITCGGVTTCGFCVSAPCGSCCSN